MFETALEKLARVLARQYHIDVIFEGNQAYTDGKKIVLPYFKDLTDEEKADLNGFLDHEVGHCKFTEMGSAKEFPQLKNRLIKEMTNCLEDIRIEREMFKEYPGCKYNIEPLRNKMHKRHLDCWDKLPAVARILLNLQYGMEGRPQKIDKDIERYMKALEPLSSKLNSCDSTRDIINLCEKMAKVLREEREEEKEEEEKEDEKGKEKGKNKGKAGMSAGKEGDEEGEGSTKGEGEGDEFDEMLSEGEGEPDSSFEGVHFDMEGHINEGLKDKIKEEPKANPDRGYSHDPTKAGMRESIPVTTRFDKVTDHSGKGNSHNYQMLRRKVKPLVQPIKTQLERVLKVKENARWKTEREQGKVNSRALAKLSTDKGYREIFKEFTKTETNNVAVEILVDMSGSMMGKMETAKMATIAMAEALKDLDIKFEVTGFTSIHDRGVEKMASELGKDRTRFNRFAERLDLHVFKDFHCMKLDGIEKLHANANNPDGECVAWAAKRLAARKEKRKILMVLSDGQPAADGNHYVLQAHLKDVVKEIQKQGIECVGIGIQTDAVKHYYPDFVVVNDISKIPTETMGKLSKIIGE